MRTRRPRRVGIACLAIFMCSCAQQPTHETAAQPVVAPTSVAEKPQPAPVQTKPKPKPKPAPTPTTTPAPEVPKPETKEPEASSSEGIDRAQVGYYFDTLQGQLRQSGDPNVVLSRHDGHITVDLTHRQTSLPTADCAALVPIAKALVEYRMTRVIVDVGAATSDKVGMKTAKDGAQAIAKCLTDAGVASKRIEASAAAASADASVMLRIEPIVKTP